MRVKPDENCFVVIEMTSVNNGVQSHFHVTMSADSTWTDLMDSAILPGLRAMGYNLDKEDLDVN